MLGWARKGAGETSADLPPSPEKSVDVQFVGIVYDQANEEAAIRHAIEEFKVPANQRDRLKRGGASVWRV
jgi:hypothetical protein